MNGLEQNILQALEQMETRIIRHVDERFEGLRVELKTEINDLRTEVNELRIEMNRRFDEIEEKQTEVIARHTEIQSRRFEVLT
jgi:hypothetical protein